ncbi:MAG: hybrid sensor histidine kinase/response regulator [Rhodocyclaceae bacterium]|nr:MAG: hybrid sensor histidine kinase/response regulator [Rhodocyclaceae bacterium]
MAAADIDTGPLSWVKGEIDLALTRAGEFLTANPDAKSIQEARGCLHQCQGALAIVGLEGVTVFTTAVEQLLEAVADNRVAWNDELRDTALTGLATLRSYLDGLMAGAADQPLALYPVYRELVLAAGRKAPPQAELFFPDLSQRPPRRDMEPEPLAADALTARLKAARLGFERGRQKWLKHNGTVDSSGLRDMRNSIAIVEQTRSNPNERALWWVALAFFDSLAEIITDPELQNLLGGLFQRLSAQIDTLAQGGAEEDVTLLRDVLYQVAVAARDSEQVRIVRAAYRLADLIPREATDASREQERIQRLQQLTNHIAAAQEDWDRFCSGTAAALPPFHEASQRIVELADGLERMDVTRLAAAIGNGANLLRKNPLAYHEALAEEMVAALLLLEGAVDDLGRPGAVQDIAFARQVDLISARLAALLRGEVPAGEERPQLEAVARRAQDKRLMAQVCKEIGINLEQVEQILDAGYRNPEHRELMEPAHLLLKQVAGAFTVLDQAAASRIADDILAGCLGLGCVQDASRRQALAEAVAERLAALNLFNDHLSRGQEHRNLLENLPPFSVQAGPVAAPLATQGNPHFDKLGANELGKQSAIDQELLAIFLDEAREVLASLDAALPALRGQPGDSTLLADVRRSFHTLKGSARMVSLDDFGTCAWAVEQRLNAWRAAGQPISGPLQTLLEQARDLLRHWVDQLNANAPAPQWRPLAQAFETLPPADSTAPAQITAPAAEPVPKVPAVSAPGVTIDTQLLPLFLEESEEAAAAIAEQLRFWRADPEDDAAPRQLRRLLHTLKGGARMVGAFAIGDRVHGLETRIADCRHPTAVFIAELEDACDKVMAEIDALRPARPAATTTAATPQSAEGADIAAASATPPAEMAEAGQGTQLRVRSDRVDQLINEAGEIAISRSRIEAELRNFKSALGDLTENVGRLRHQLREIEIQAESQMGSRLAQANDQHAGFDPLEMDRFTAFQELTRMMAESVEDVSTVHHALLRGLEHTETTLVAQARLNRDLSLGLLRVRMVPFAAIAERLQRVLRQTAKELGKQAVLKLEGEQTEMDRSVLERLIAPLEHLLRNALVHGVEALAERRRLGKADAGTITLSLSQHGGEVGIELADDGAGLDLARIRQKGRGSGLITAEAALDEQSLIQLIFQPGFSTASSLSSLAGRGVGLDVVRNEVVALGGRIEVHSEAHQGCRFQLTLPVTLAIGQALLVKVGNDEEGNARCLGIPAGMVEQADEMNADDMEALRREGSLQHQGRHYPWHYLPRLLGREDAVPRPQRRHWRVLLRGGPQQIALEVDAVVGKQEVVMKAIGPQLEKLPGIAGATVLGDGEIALIVNPVALAERYHRLHHSRSGGLAPMAPVQAPPAPIPQPATVLVVDDSLTVRKVTGRLLERAGYRVLTAKDGVDALEQLNEELPAVVLADIEMPRMDGFELVRSLRSDPRLRDLPVIMITSRTADKHRNVAAGIGVEHFLGKPYDEEELLKLIGDYVG